MNKFEYIFEKPKHPSEIIYNEIVNKKLKTNEYIIKKAVEYSNSSNYYVNYITNLGNIIYGNINKNNMIHKMKLNNNKPLNSIEIQILKKYNFKNRNPKKLKKEFLNYLEIVGNILLIINKDILYDEKESNNYSDYEDNKYKSTLNITI